MALTLLLEASNISSDGEFITISDATVYDQVDLRSDIALYLGCSVNIESVLTHVNPLSYDPAVATEWTVPTVVDGNYAFKSYAFYTKAGGPTPVSGDVRYDEGNDRLEQYDGSSWVTVSVTEAITDQKYAAGSVDIYVPVLSKSYIYKNKLNLLYIEESKKIIENGTNHNKLFVKRNSLDYFSALILGAEYNWALALYTNVDKIITNLNNIMATDTLS